MPYANENVRLAAVSQNTETSAALVAAPGAGKTLAIDGIYISAIGGANRITLTGDGGTTNAVIQLAANQFLPISNDINSPNGIFPCAANTAFSLALGAATLVSGYILYRIINQ